MDQILLEYTDKDTQYYNVDYTISELYKHNCPNLFNLKSNFDRMITGLQYSDIRKDHTDKSIDLETNISPAHFKPLEIPITLYRGIQLPSYMKYLETPSKSYISTVSINNISNIRTKNAIMIIRVHPGTILFNLSNIDCDFDQYEIVLDKGGTFYINDYIIDGLSIQNKTMDILKVTYFPKQHCATLYPQLSYETLLKSSCNVLPSLFMEDSSSVVNIEKFEQRYIKDIKMCENLNTMILKRDPQTSLRVLTYNVHEWMDRSHKNTQEECIHAIIEIDPDIVCLQEVTEQLPKTLLLAYPYNYVINSEPYADYTLYMAVLSKYPIRYSEKIALQSCDPNRIKESRDCIHCIVDYNGKDTHIYNIHLSLELDIAINQINDIYNIINNYNISTREYYIKKINTPLIIAGDFNHIDSNNYTQYELGFLNKNNIYKNTPVDLYKDIRRVMQIDKTPENFNKIRYTVWSSRAVDFIFPNMEMFSYVYSGFYYTIASDHLPYFMDLRLARVSL